MCNKVHRRHTGIPLEMITSFKPITDLTHRALKQFVILWCTPMCHSSLCSLVPRLLVGTHRESLGTRLQFVILWCTPSFQVTLCGRPGASPLPPLPPHWYQSSLHRNRRCTFSITSFPGPAQLSTTFPYCKRRKAGRGLGTRLRLVFHWK